MQARILPRAYLIALQAGVEVIYWYEFQAPEQKPEYNEHHFGIVHRDLSPKPAYTAIRTLARARPAGSKAVDRSWRTAELYHPGWQRPDGRVAWALWRLGQEQAHELHVQGAIQEAFDHLGGPLDLNVEAGRVRLSLSEAPVYLVGPTAVEAGRPGQ